MMGSGQVGTREVVAIAAAAVAVIFALFFFAPTSTSGGERLPISTGEPVTEEPTATETGTPVPTEEPAVHLDDPGQWLVTIYGGHDPVNGVADSAGILPALELDYQNSPAIGLRDDDWSLTASTSADVPAGRYTFVLELDGTFEVLIQGKSPETGVDAAGTRELTLTLDHPGGRLDIAVTARDAGGPLRIAWR